MQDYKYLHTKHMGRINLYSPHQTLAAYELAKAEGRSTFDVKTNGWGDTIAVSVDEFAGIDR
jgi:uncharacterized glyoxalase superfamily protein PhnB